MASRTNRPPRNRKKSARFRAAKKLRVKRKIRLSRHGQRIK